MSLFSSRATALPIADESRDSAFLRAIIYVLAAIFTLWATTTVVLLGSPITAASYDETVWYAIRAAGIASYLLMTASMGWGIALSSKAVKRWVPASVALDLHNYLSWSALGLAVLHAALLLATDFFDYSLLNLLVPFTGPYEPLWVGIGIIAFYLMVLATVTFYLIKHIGNKTFRRIHYLTYLSFALALIHAIQAGTDSVTLMPLYFGTALAVLFLTLFRIFKR